MNFLHRSGILHRDLKPDNLLVMSLNVNAPAMIKLSDFGSSRSINEELARNYTAGIGTPIYMAPEILTKEAYSVKADVYSFAVLLYELYDEKTPYEDFKHSWDVAKYVTEGKRPPRIEGCPDEYWKIIEKCWVQEPTDRPTFEEILKDFQDIYDALPEESILASLAQSFGSMRMKGNTLSVTERDGKMRSMSKSEGYRLVVEKIDDQGKSKSKSLGRDAGLGGERRRKKHKKKKSRSHTAAEPIKNNIPDISSSSTRNIHSDGDNNINNNDNSNIIPTRKDSHISTPTRKDSTPPANNNSNNTSPRSLVDPKIENTKNSATRENSLKRFMSARKTSLISGTRDDSAL